MRIDATVNHSSAGGPPDWIAQAPALDIHTDWHSDLTVICSDSAFLDKLVIVKQTELLGG